MNGYRELRHDGRFRAGAPQCAWAKSLFFYLPLATLATLGTAPVALAGDATAQVNDGGPLEVGQYYPDGTVLAIDTSTTPAGTATLTARAWEQAVQGANTWQWESQAEVTYEADETYNPGGQGEARAFAHGRLTLPQQFMLIQVTLDIQTESATQPAGYIVVRNARTWEEYLSITGPGEYSLPLDGANFRQVMIESSVEIQGQFESGSTTFSHSRVRAEVSIVPDCNQDGVSDPDQIANGDSQDCNQNGVPDECDIEDRSLDCDGNLLVDSCEVEKNPSLDCDHDSVHDSCQLNIGDATDCDGNTILDSCDIFGSENDLNANGLPDVCEVPTLYVNLNAVGMNHGRDEANAYTTLDAALKHANLTLNIDEAIQVRPGVYRPQRRTDSADSRSATFLITRPTNLIGDKAILSGDLQGNDGASSSSKADNIYHVITVRGANGVVDLNRLTIAGGNANAVGHFEGGGILAVNSSLRLDACQIIDNKAGESAESSTIAQARKLAGKGGALYVQNLEAAEHFLQLKDSYLGRNEAFLEGGALAIKGMHLIVSKCNFDDNRAASGGALAITGEGAIAQHATISQSGFWNNNSESAGSAISASIVNLSVNDSEFQKNISTAADVITLTDAAAAHFDHCYFQENSGALCIAGQNIATPLAVHDSQFYLNSGFGIISASELLIAGSMFLENQNEGAISGERVTIEGSIVQRNQAQYGQAAVSAGQLIIRSSKFLHNDSGSAGAVEAGVLEVLDSEFANNTAAHLGGAIHTGDGKIRNCTFLANQAPYGGAIAVPSGELECESCVFSSNAASWHGGAIYVLGLDDSSVVLRDSIFESNTAGSQLSDNQAAAAATGCFCDSHGGALYVEDASTLTIEDSTFAGNHAQCGGAIMADLREWSTLSIKQSDFSANAADCGGAVWASEASVEIDDSTFTDNTAEARHAGALYLVFSPSVRLQSSVFDGNESNGIGAVYIDGLETIQLDECDFRYNVSNTGSVVVLAVHGALQITDSAIVFNQGGTAIAGGEALLRGVDYSYNDGSVFINRGELTVSNSRFSYNSNDTSGGAIESGRGPIYVSNSLFEYNSSNEGGGAVSARQGARFEDSQFRSNHAQWGGARAAETNTLIERCLFLGNSAPEGGAAVLNGTVRNSMFHANHATVGGALSPFSSDDPLNVYNSLFNSNSASLGGGIAASAAPLLVRNCTFANNIAYGAGAAILFSPDSELINSIVWNNAIGEVRNEWAQLGNYQFAAFSYNTIEGWSGDFGGIGNDGNDPIFVSLEDPWGPVSPDLHLLPDSPAIDSGDPDFEAAPGEADLDGKPRVLCGPVDRGAYEFGVVGDIDCDQSLTLADFAEWTACETGPGDPQPLGDCQALDAQVDGLIDLHDFAGFSNQFGD